MSRIRAHLLLFVLLTTHSLANAEPAVVFGSFSQSDNAMRLREDVAAKLGERIEVRRVLVAGSERYRVVWPYSGSKSAAVSRARAMGFESAWSIDMPPSSGSALAQVPDTVKSAPAAVAEVSRSGARQDNGVPEDPSVPGSSAASVATPAQALTAGGSDSLLIPENTDRDDITIPKLPSEQAGIQLDGRLDEALWQQIPGYDNMLVMDPDTLADPSYTTTARFFYTDDGLYIGAFMQQPPETLIARLSSRDEFVNRDSFGITIDTSGEGLYGYWFSVNLGGTQGDGKVAPERQFSREWDGPWESATAELDNGWSAEFFLPWSMMTIAEGKQGDPNDRKFGFWLNRKVAHLDERWSWPALPFASKRFMSALATMRTPDVATRQQIALFPYASATLDDISGENKSRVGADVFWRPNSKLQVTATVNPDFGAVESDDVVVNLTAFETFFPEKRLFFLEGIEVFNTTPRSQVRGQSPSGQGARQTTTTFNPEPTTLLNTRRIGGPPQVDVPKDVDVSGVELGKPTNLMGAAKITGQAGSFRYGVLSAFEDDMRLPAVYNSGAQQDGKLNLDTSGRDFGVARVLYEKVGQGRVSFGYLGTLVRYDRKQDAQVNALDAHWLSKNGAWQLDGQLMASDVDKIKGYGAMYDMKYKPRQGIEHKLALDYFDAKLDVSDLGFIRRNDVTTANYSFNSSTGRGLTRLRNKRTSIMISHSWNMDGRSVRSGLFFRNGWTFKNRNELRTEFNYFPARWDDRNSFDNGSFRIDDRWVGEVALGTDTSKPVSLSGLIGMRQEELSGWTVRSSLGMTFKPSDRFSLDIDLNYFDRDGWLLHNTGRVMSTYAADDLQPRLAMDWFLSAKQQLRLTLQWAGITADSQEHYLIPVGGGKLVRINDPVGAGVVAALDGDFTVSRLTSQLRYRWEIGPLSDLFVVYTRGSNIPSQLNAEFSDLFQDSISYPIVDNVVVKLRYRFGN